jgi:hypothetical protein
MVGINLDLVIQGAVDLRIAGYIGLNEGGQITSGSATPPIPHTPHSPPSLPRGNREAEQIGRDQIEGDGRSRAVDVQSQAERALNRAARKTRDAMLGLRESIGRQDAQLIRRAIEHLRQRVMRLNEEVERGGTAQLRRRA